MGGKVRCALGIVRGAFTKFHRAMSVCFVTMFVIRNAETVRAKRKSRSDIKRNVPKK